MYRVIGADGQPYVAPDLATLQMWVDQQRVAPTMQIEDMRQGVRVPASSIQGLRWPAISSQTMSPSPFTPSMGAYPRPAQVQLPWAMSIAGTVLGAIFCCVGMGLGIAGIVYCSNASRAMQNGDYYGAQTAAASAQNWAKWSLVLSALGLVLNIVIGGIGLADVLLP
jgi:hypothetical protein